MQICGREFKETDLKWIRDQVSDQPELNRIQLSRLFCRHTDWRKPDGGLKEMSCRVALLRLKRQGLIDLPEPRTRPALVRPVLRTPQGEPQAEVTMESRVELALWPVESRTSPLWNELIDRYHYLGYCRAAGAQMRFFVKADNQLIALLGFSAAAWRVGPREAFIGWSEAQRLRNLHRVVDNSRFLILPWVKGKNLASRILALSARRLPDYWQQRYGYRPLLLETFVEHPRFAGTCYKAANWICVGQTQGRGKWDRFHTHHQPIKTIWLYPLNRRFREGLCG